MGIFGNLGLGIGKSRRPQTIAEWQALVDNLPRHERDRIAP